MKIETLDMGCMGIFPAIFLSHEYHAYKRGEAIISVAK